MLMLVFILNVHFSSIFFSVSSDEKERLRRLKEMKTKQVEMEAMREAELKFKRKVCCINSLIIFTLKYVFH